MGNNYAKQLVVKSSAFAHNSPIPQKYTCDGENISPPIEISNVPAQAKSLALIVDDPDAVSGVWDHWVVWNIPTHGKIVENSEPGVTGKSSWNRNSYGGPCPPSGKHRYFFKAYALDTVLELPKTAGKKELEAAMDGHILGHGEMIGLYKRKGRGKI